MERVFQKELKLSAQKVWFESQKIFVQCSDGRIVGNPLTWFPRLANATESQLNDFEIFGNGTGIHWNELDEDLSINGFVYFSPY